jgi:hypothetical protein
MLLAQIRRIWAKSVGWAGSFRDRAAEPLDLESPGHRVERFGGQNGQHFALMGQFFALRGEEFVKAEL